MGTFAIWHWLIVMVVLLISLLVPVLLVKYALGRFSRRSFALRFFPTFIIVVFAWAITGGAPLALVGAAILNLLNYRWTALRLNDVGVSRWLALLWFFWPAGLIMAIVLCFKPTPIEDIAPVFD